MNQEERNMLIRHDEQLKAVPRLCDSVDRLSGVVQDIKEAIQEVKVSKKSYWQTILVLGSIISCIGTWVILIKTAK